jgi:hypothetical protein
VIDHALYNFGRSDDKANREQAEAALDLGTAPRQMTP